MDKYSELLEKIEEVKMKLSDNEYKELVENLSSIRKHKVTKVYEIELTYNEIQQVPFLSDCCDKCFFNSEIYSLELVEKTHKECITVDSGSSMYEYLNDNYDTEDYNESSAIEFLEEIEKDNTIEINNIFAEIAEKKPVRLEVIVNKSVVNFVTFKTFKSLAISRIH